MLIVSKGFCFGIKSIQSPAPEANPEFAGVIFIQPHDSTVIQAMGISGIMLVTRKTFCIPVKPIEAIKRA